MNLNYNSRSYPSLQEYIITENDGGNLYGKRFEFAHEVDSTVLRVLESAHIQSIVNRFADVLVSFESGTDISSGIVIDKSNFPEIFNVLQHCCKTLGVRIPHAVVSSSMQGINAYASGTVDMPYLLISDLATKLLTIDELCFIIGHECGHLAMEHLVYHFIGKHLYSLGTKIPVIGPTLAKTLGLPLNTWSRYSEITCDRAGFICCGDLKTAQRALMKLESGFANVSDVDLDVYVEQSLSSLENMKVGVVKEYFYDHPLTPKRLKALELFSQSELYYRVTGKTAPNGIVLMNDTVLKEKVDALLTVLK